MEKRIKELAHIIIHHSVRLNQGEKIIIDLYGEQAVPLGKALVNEAYAVGGYPVANFIHIDLMKEWMKGVTDGQMDYVAECEMVKMKGAHAHICVKSFDNTSIYDGVPKDKVLVYKRNMMPVAMEKTNNTKWLFTMFPTEVAAKCMGMDYNALLDYYYALAILDYNEVSKAMAKLADMLDHTDIVRIVGDETDISFSIKGIKAHADFGYYNLPDGEVRTAPVRDSVNGRLKVNLPVKYEDKIYNDFILCFSEGKIVDVLGKDQKAVSRILDTDEGSRYIGEFALGTNPMADRPTGEILFDEKLWGSFHITPGQCYIDSDNGNNSLVHWDLVCMQTPAYGGGEIFLDGRSIRKNGKFTDQELLALNGDNRV